MLSDTIMIVDDDPRVIASVRLTLDNYEVIGFQNGYDAIDYLKKPNKVSLVLLDVFMRDVDGMSVLSAIKNINKDMLVVIITAYGSMDLAVQALRYRADDFMEKPFKVDELREKVKVLLKEKSYMDKYANSNDDKVARIKKFVERNHMNVSLEHLADEMCLSEKYISRMFKEKNDKSFRDYKLQIKIEKAKSLLESSSYSVSQISENLGYQNPESFMRIFKKRTNCTPSQYRSRCHRSRKALKKTARN